MNIAYPYLLSYIYIYICKYETLALEVIDAQA